MVRMLISALFAWITALGFARAAEVINFDTYPDGTPVPEGFTVSDQWRSLGVVFTMGDSVSAAYAVPHACSLSQPNHVGGDPVVLAWFVDPATGAPAVTDFVGTAQDLCPGNGEGILMQAYDIHGQLVAHQFNAGPGNLVTFTFPEPTVAMLRMEEVGQGIDDFTFNIPVPATPVGVEDDPANGANDHLDGHLEITPNPVGVSSRTQVRFDLQSAHVLAVTLQVYDVRGRRVRSLLHGEFGQGRQVIEWDGRDDHGMSVAPGVYFVRWTGGGGSGAEKVTILR